MNPYPENYWSTRVHEERVAAEMAERERKREDGAWLCFLVLYVVIAAGIFAMKELPHGPQAIPVWLGEIVYFSLAAWAAWRYCKVT